MRNVEININKIQQQYDAGIRYEHKASKLTVTLPDDFPKEADFYLLNFENNVGSKKTSNKLTPVGGKVTYIVPEMLTKSSYQLVALSAYKTDNENDIEIYRSPKFKLKFGDTVVSSDIASENAQDAFQEVINLIKIGKLKGDSGKSAYELACEAGYRGTVAEWLLSLIGKSAYTVAVENGFEGTPDEWLESLIGADGKSAYEVAVENGFKGTQTEWLATIKGERGEPGIQGVPGVQGVPGIKGDSGKSAYEVAVENGFEGTQTEWLDELKAVKRIPGTIIAADNLSDGFYITSQKSIITYNGHTWQVNAKDEHLEPGTVFHINNQMKDVKEIGTILTAFGGQQWNLPFMFLFCGSMSTPEIVLDANISNNEPQQGLRNAISSGAVYLALKTLKKEIVDIISQTSAVIETKNVAGTDKKFIHITKTNAKGETTEYISEEYDSSNVVSGVIGAVIDDVSADNTDDSLTKKLLSYAENKDFQKACINKSGKIYFRCAENGKYSFSYNVPSNEPYSVSYNCKVNDIVVAVIDFTYNADDTVDSYAIRILSKISFLDNNGDYLTKKEIQKLIEAIEMPKKLSDIVDDDGKTAADEVKELLKAKNIKYDDSNTFYNCNNLQDLMDKLALDLGYRIIEQDGTPQKILDAVEGGVAPLTFALGDIIKIPVYVGTTKESIRQFRVVDYDNAEILDNTARHSMTLMSRYVDATIAFDSGEATYYADEEMPAGDYYFLLTSSTYVSFTTTKTIPAGGIFRYIYAGNGGADGTISTYASVLRNDDSSMQIIESGLTCTLGQVGTQCTPVNILDRTRYGCNRALFSDAKKYLNSNRPASQHSWQPDAGRKYCIEPAWSLTTDGYLYGFSQEWLDIFAPHYVTLARSSADGGGFDKFVELVSMASITQMYGGTNNGISEGEPFRYYKEGSTLSAPGTGTDSFRKQYSSSGSVSNVRLASANVSNSYNAYILNATGTINNNYFPTNTYGLVPFVTIAKKS